MEWWNVEVRMREDLKEFFPAGAETCRARVL
jgi:hypothetical protein